MYLLQKETRLSHLVLAGHLNQYYFDYYDWNNLYHKTPLWKALKNRIVSPERTKGLHREWKSMTLQNFKATNSDRSLSVRLELMIKELSEI